MPTPTCQCTVCVTITFSLNNFKVQMSEVSLSLLVRQEATAPFQELLVDFLEVVGLNITCHITFGDN